MPYATDIVQNSQKLAVNIIIEILVENLLMLNIWNFFIEV